MWLILGSVNFISEHKNLLEKVFFTDIILVIGADPIMSLTILGNVLVIHRC